MKQLGSAKEMQQGKVYNLVYTGSNEAYGKVNGKRTIRVTQTEPTFQYIQLYDQFGHACFDDLHSGEVTVSDLSLTFNEDEIFEPEGEEEWFKHSAKFTSLGAAVQQGLLTIEQIEQFPVKLNRNSFVAHMNQQSKLQGVFTSFNAKSATNPMLQRIYIWWSSWEEVYADFRQYGVDARQ